MVDLNVDAKNQGEYSADRSGTIALGLASFFLFLANVVSRYPGIGNPDSKYQYAQAMSGYYNDWHPPVMARLWSVLRLFADGDGTLYVLHIFCYWLGFGLIAITLSRCGRRGTGWLLLATGLFPPFLMMNINIHKDVGLAVAFLASFATLFWFRAQEKPVKSAAAVIALLFLSYGILVRMNGVFAAAPLLIYMFYPRLIVLPLRLIVSCLIIVLITIPAVDAFNRAVLDATPTHHIRSLEIYDIAGIARFSGDMSVFGAENSFTTQQVSDCYTPLQWDTMTDLGKCHVFWDRLALSRQPGGPTQPPDHRSAMEDPPNPELRTLWLSAIVKRPLAYLEHRVIHFNSELYLIVPRHHADFRVMFHIVYNESIDASEFKTTKGKFMDVLRNNPFSTPVFFLALSFIVLFLSWPRANQNSSPLRDGAFCLTISGVLYTLPYFVIGIASDVRYQFWTMIAAFIGFIIYVSAEPHHVLPPSRTGWICIAVLAATAITVLVANLILGDVLFLPDGT
jgi:hypothetical protein